MTLLRDLLIPLALAVTLVVLALGVTGLTRRGAADRARSNRLMQARIAAQAIAIGLIMLFLYLADRR